VFITWAVFPRANKNRLWLSTKLSSPIDAAQKTVLLWK
jgi:hypothetical protein